MTLNKSICYQCLQIAINNCNDAYFLGAQEFPADIRLIFNARINRNCCAFVHEHEQINMLKQYDEPLINKIPDWCPYKLEQVVQNEAK